MILMIMLSMVCNPLSRFDILFLKRFWCVMRVAFPKLCSKSSLLLILLIFTRAAGKAHLSPASPTLYSPFSRTYKGDAVG